MWSKTGAYRLQNVTFDLDTDDPSHDTAKVDRITNDCGNITGENLAVFDDGKSADGASLNFGQNAIVSRSIFFFCELTWKMPVDGTRLPALLGVISDRQVKL